MQHRAVGSTNDSRCSTFRPHFTPRATRYASTYHKVVWLTRCVLFVVRRIAAGKHRFMCCCAQHIEHVAMRQVPSPASGGERGDDAALAQALQRRRQCLDQARLAGQVAEHRRKTGEVVGAGARAACSASPSRCSMPARPRPAGRRWRSGGRPRHGRAGSAASPPAQAPGVRSALRQRDGRASSPAGAAGSSASRPSQSVRSDAPAPGWQSAAAGAHGSPAAPRRRAASARSRRATVASMKPCSAGWAMAESTVAHPAITPR